MLADGTIDSDLFPYLRDALLLLLLVGGALFVFTTVVLGQDSVSSAQSRRAKLLPRHDVLSAEKPRPPELGAGLLRDQSPSRAKDKRRALRRRGNPVPVLVSDGLIPDVQGLVLNRSRGGLCLCVPHSVEVGQTIAVRTQQFPEGLAAVQLRVRHCQRKGDGYRLGCQFVEELPWTAILMFG
jgi:hypothetical protein